MSDKVAFIKPRHLVYGGIFLVVAQLGLIALFDFKPPQYAAGHDVESRDAAEPAPQNQVSRDKRLEIEAMLSPVPVIAYVSPSKTRLIPRQGRDLIMVSPVYIKTLPDLSKLTVNARKRRFISFMLPLILRSNQELEERRERITDTFKQDRHEELEKWALLYDIEPEGLTGSEIHAELVLRVQPVSVSIALAQAAIESGWGTSRFAVEGNAVFGQWAWLEEAGIKPIEARYDNAVVRSFDNIFTSVRAYMHNLNTHYAYENFRKVRGASMGAPVETRLPALLQTLDQYSEKRDAYIDILFDVMEDNDLWQYEQAQLTTP